MKAEQGATGQPSVHDALDWLYHRMRDEAEADTDLSTSLSEATGRLVEVSTYSAPFELRKVQFIWSVQDATVAAEDARVITFHLAKISGGAVSPDWVAADFTALDAAFTTWWTALKVNYPTKLTWDRLKVYKAGPAVFPPQIPVYDADKNVAGTAAANLMPPQVAISVTEIAGTKRYWGRFYLPGMAVGSESTFGRITSATQTLIADRTDDLYTALKAAGLEVVVYRAPLPERETRAGTTLPARNGSAWTVEKIQVDDVFDVVRRRRYKFPTLRVQRDI